MEYTNKIIAGDCLTVMRSIADDSVDVTFADPPFNLKKKYNGYIDSRKFEEYLHWCQQWIEQMVRITKPAGSIFVHNIPRWLTYYASFLNSVADFRHWISWSAPTSPMGKSLQPAHYGILFYAKDIKQNKCYELRSPHKRDRKSVYLSKDYGGKKAGLHPFGPLVSDVWTDIHRVKHNKYRDEHPCQLPIHLLERLILMSSDEGDTVLDPFMGTGTTALAAKRLGRKYIGIELDAKYVEIAENKLTQEISDSKLGDAWVSFFLRKVVTLRDIDWDIIKSYFAIPEDPKQVDVTEIELNKDIDEIMNMRHISRRSVRKKSDRPDKKSLSSRLSQDRTLFDTDGEPAKKEFKMKVPPDERILTKERLNELASVFADCLKELYADKLPNPKFIVYMQTPKSNDQGGEFSGFMYSVCDDSVDEETLDTYINSVSQALNQCFLDKLSPNKDRDPEQNWVGYYGQVLSLKGELTSKGNKSIGDLPLDESQWIKMVEFAQEKNWYSKFEIIGGAVIGSIIEIPIQEIWELLKARLSEDTDLIEKIKDLPIEEVLEEIKKHLSDFIL